MGGGGGGDSRYNMKSIKMGYIHGQFEIFEI